MNNCQTFAFVNLGQNSNINFNYMYLMNEIFVPIYLNLFKGPFMYLPLKYQAFRFSYSKNILYIGDTNPSDINSEYFCIGQDVAQNDFQLDR